MIKRAQNTLFYILIFLLPLNLGKHFIVSGAYVKSHLIDYLVPTVWVTDILVLVLVMLWMFSGGLKSIYSNFTTKFFLLFFSVLLPSLVIAPRLVPSFYYILELLLHILFMFVVLSTVNLEKEWEKIVNILSGVVIVISILGFFQWVLQGSVFDNYLFFGEQPYGIDSKNIALTSFFGLLRIPIYGLFRHPNIFGGFLAIILLWIFSQLLNGEKKVLYKAAFVFGAIALLLTFSQVALLSLLLGMYFLFVIKKHGKMGVLLSIVITGFIFMTSLFFPVLSKVGWFNDDPSIYRRANLQKSTYMMLEDNALFGVGAGNFIVVEEEYLPGSQVLRFLQPVHNIFLLVFAESGIFSLIAFITILLLVIVVLLEQPFGTAAVLFVTVLQFFILGSFDHYLLTIQQMQLLFWLTLGLSLTYTKEDAEV